MNLAIIIGVSQYDNGNTLIACDNDIKIMKNISDKLNKFDDICYISNSPKAYEAKQLITEFVNKHQDQVIEEFVFYFSGHGARYNDDFFYIFKDFIEEKKETTKSLLHFFCFCLFYLLDYFLLYILLFGGDSLF